MRRLALVLLPLVTGACGCVVRVGVEQYWVSGRITDENGAPLVRAQVRAAFTWSTLAESLDTPEGREMAVVAGRSRREAALFAVADDENPPELENDQTPAWNSVYAHLSDRHPVGETLTDRDGEFQILLELPIRAWGLWTSEMPTHSARLSVKLACRHPALRWRWRLAEREAHMRPLRPHTGGAGPDALAPWTLSRPAGRQVPVLCENRSPRQVFALCRAPDQALYPEPELAGAPRLRPPSADPDAREARKRDDPESRDAARWPRAPLLVGAEGEVFVENWWPPDAREAVVSVFSSGRIVTARMISREELRQAGDRVRLPPQHLWETLSNADQAVAAHPQQAEVYSRRAKLCELAGLPHQARADYTRALECADAGERAQRLFERGQSAFEAGLWKEAEEDFLAVREFAPDHPANARALARLLRDRFDYRGAELTILRALAKHPSMAELWDDLADIADLLGHPDDSETAARNARTLRQGGH